MYIEIQSRQSESTPEKSRNLLKLIYRPRDSGRRHVLAQPFKDLSLSLLWYKRGRIYWLSILLHSQSLKYEGVAFT